MIWTVLWQAEHRQQIVERQRPTRFARRLRGTPPEGPRTRRGRTAAGSSISASRSRTSRSTNASGTCGSANSSGYCENCTGGQRWRILPPSSSHHGCSSGPDRGRDGPTARRTAAASGRLGQVGSGREVGGPAERGNASEACAADCQSFLRHEVAEWSCLPWRKESRT